MKLFWSRFFTLGGWFTYAALIGLAVGVAGTAVGASQMSNAREGYEAQLKKYKTFEPVQPDDPKLLDWRALWEQVISGNLNNLPRARELAHKTNLFQTKEQQAMLSAFQPHWQALQDQIGRNALSFSKGELPADVVSNIGRAAAQSGIQRGFGMGASGVREGTAFGNLRLRDLGLTSLDLSKYGTNLAMQAGLQAKQLSPGLFDPTSMMLNPAQGIAFEATNVDRINENARYWNQLQNQARLENTGIANTANQMIAEGNLAARAAQAQMWAEMGQSAGSAIGGMGGTGTKKAGTKKTV